MHVVGGCTRRRKGTIRVVEDIPTDGWLADPNPDPNLDPATGATLGEELDAEEAARLRSRRIWMIFAGLIGTCILIVGLFMGLYARDHPPKDPPVTDTTTSTQVTRPAPTQVEVPVPGVTPSGCHRATSNTHLGGGITA